VTTRNPCARVALVCANCVNFQRRLIDYKSDYSRTAQTTAAAMKLQGSLTINGKHYRAGDEVRWTTIYPFFFLHMGMFGASGFFMAYADHPPPTAFLFMHGGFAIFIYVVFYLSIFGREEVKWMFINAALGVFGIYTEMRWIMAAFGKSLSDYPIHVHVIPFLYYVLYTFLLRHAVLDIADAREDEARRTQVERWYVGGSIALYAGVNLLRL
jgi:hypothetical protein